MRDDLKDKQVLIVEDDATLCELWRKMFNDAPYAVNIVEDPQEALDLYLGACVLKKPFDLVLTDLDLSSSRYTGITLVEAMRKEECKTKIIFVTGKPLNDGIKLSANVLHVWQIWTKPPLNFRRKVEDVLSMPDDMDANRRRKNAVEPSMEQAIDYKLKMPGLIWGIYLLLTLSVGIQGFSLYRSMTTAPAIMEMRDTVRTLTGNQKGSKTLFRASVPDNKTGLVKLKDGRTRITFEVVADDAEKLEKLASERNKSYLICVGK